MVSISVSDPHQDDADPDPRICIGRFGAGSYSLRKDIFKEEIKTEKGHEKILIFF